MPNLDFTMSRRGLLAGLAGLGLAATGLAGCGGGNEDKPAGSTPAKAESSYDPVTLKVAYMPNLGSAGSLFAAIDQQQALAAQNERKD